MAVDVGFQYDLARFIDFRDAAECDRVRRIRRTELTEHANPDFRIAVATAFGALIRCPPLCL